jgi:lantibiotic biosynthesis protein
MISGSAGAIPALLALSRLPGGGDLVEAAARHARFLIDSANRGDRGWSWATVENRYSDLTGFAHGAAGIAFALLETFHATGDPAFREAAVEGFRYERSVFVPDQENWPDFRFPPKDGKTACAVMWCAGAPGIGLSRLRAWKLLGDPIYREEAEAAIRTTSRWLAGSEDGNYSLCHGNAGNVELLLDSGEASHREIARRVGEAGMRRYEEESVSWPCGIQGRGETLGLMLGQAGIAHFYLRLHDAQRTPSVLMVTR